MTDPQPTGNHSTSGWTRLRAAWRLMVEAVRQAIPAEDPPCEHGLGAGYCLDCDFEDQEDGGSI